MWRAAMAAMCASKPRRRAACALACTCRADLWLRPESSERVGYPLINGYGCLRPVAEVRRDRRERLVRPHFGHFTAPSAGAGLRAKSSGRLWIDATFKVETGALSLRP